MSEVNVSIKTKGDQITSMVIHADGLPPDEIQAIIEIAASEMKTGLPQISEAYAKSGETKCTVDILDSMNDEMENAGEVEGFDKKAAIVEMLRQEFCHPDHCKDCDPDLECDAVRDVLADSLIGEHKGYDPFQRAKQQEAEKQAEMQTELAKVKSIYEILGVALKIAKVEGYQV